MIDFDIAVVGSGFAGSLLAMVLKRMGRSVVLLERGAHPRFAIGESSTPLANLLLEELAQTYELPRLTPLCKWGAWQKAYPAIACGLKRGFSFYHHTAHQPWIETPDRRNHLLVAASPHDGIADTHWYRPDFDHFLVREAQNLGVEYLDRVQLGKPEIGPGAITLNGQREGQTLSLKARFLFDAGGGRGYLRQVNLVPQQPLPYLPPTQALFSHFSGVRRLQDICPTAESPPYAVDDAALHHVFDGGWIWMLRFNNGLSSGGIAATAPLAAELRLEEGAPAWQRLLKRFPTVGEQFAESKSQAPFVFTRQLSFRSATAAGPGWALLPSAAGFVDPLLSSGFPLTLLGIRRLAEIMERDWGSNRFQKSLAAYSDQTLSELDGTAHLVAGLYRNMRDFPLFSRLSLLYFAAASFTETARRLGRPELAGPAFLMGGHPVFGPRSRACCEMALGRLDGPGRDNLNALILEAIAPVDVAGLGDPSRHNWFPVDARDLFAAAPRLGVGRAEIEQLLARCGFSPSG